MNAPYHRLLFFFLEIMSTNISSFIKALAKARLTNPLPNIQTFIIIFNFNNKN